MQEVHFHIVIVMWHFPLCSRQGWASYLLWHFWMGNFPSLNFHLSHNTFVSFYIGTYYDAQNVRLVKWHGMKTCQPTNVLFESWKIHSLPICYLLETFLTVYAFLWLPASCALYVKVHYISTLRVFDILSLPLAPAPSITIDQIYRAYAAASVFCQATFYCMGQLLCVPRCATLCKAQ